MAVTKTANSVTMDTLEGKKTCHTGMRKTSGWNVPIGYLISSGKISVADCKGDILAAGRYFSQSCAPGRCGLELDL